MATVRKRTWVHTPKAELGEEPPPSTTKTAWVVAYSDQTGKRRLKTFERKKDADAHRLQVEVEIEGGVHVPANASTTMAAALDGWIKACEMRYRIKDRMTLASLTGYRGRAARIGNDFALRNLAEISFEDYQKYITNLSLKYSPKSISDIVQVLRMALDHAVGQGWLKRNILRDRRLRTPALDRKTKIPTRAELHLILKKAAERFDKETVRTGKMRMVFVTLAMFGGLRGGEICGLRWQDIDFEKEEIHINHSFSRYDGLKSPKTKAGVRTVPLVPAVIEALHELKATARAVQPDSMVLTSRTGKALLPGALQVHWGRLCREAGLIEQPVEDGKPAQLLYGLHSLRHAAVSLFIEHGLSLTHIKTLVGHAKIQTTVDVYGNIFDDDPAIKNAAKGIAAKFAATSMGAVAATSTRHDVLTH